MRGYLILFKHPETSSNFTNNQMASGHPGIHPVSSSKHYLLIFPPISLSLDKNHTLAFSRGAFFLLVVKMLQGNPKGRGKDVGNSLLMSDSELLGSNQMSTLK